jgi:hypothetical protein
MGRPPQGEGHDRCGALARGSVATGGMALGLSRAPGLLALQLRQFRVDRAQTPLTGDVLPPTHHEGAPPAVGPPLATGSVLEISEPSMDGVQHCGSPSPLSEPHGCGPLRGYPETCLGKKVELMES